MFGYIYTITIHDTRMKKYISNGILGSISSMCEESHKRYKDVEAEIDKVLGGKITSSDIVNGRYIEADLDGIANIVGLHILIRKVSRLRRKHQLIYYPDDIDPSHESVIQNYDCFSSMLNRKILLERVFTAPSSPIPCPIMVRQTTVPSTLTEKKRKQKYVVAKDRKSPEIGMDEIKEHKEGIVDYLRYLGIKEGIEVIIWPYVERIPVSRMSLGGVKTKIGKIFAREPVMIELRNGMSLSTTDGLLWSKDDISYCIFNGINLWRIKCHEALFHHEIQIDKTCYKNSSQTIICHGTKITVSTFPISKWNITMNRGGRDIVVEMTINNRVIDLLYDITVTWIVLPSRKKMNGTDYLSILSKMFYNCMNLESEYDPEHNIPDVPVVRRFVERAVDEFRRNELPLIYEGEHEINVSRPFIFAMMAKISELMRYGRLK